MIKCITILARRRREKIISFTLDKDGTFIWALGPGTTCWPGGGLKCSPGVGGSKMASRGVELLFTPPTHTYALSTCGSSQNVEG